jgi:ectoine hydroxylase-related dioxygenase (phytanoyl-CoA dioxygenase family)
MFIIKNLFFLFFAKLRFLFQLFQFKFFKKQRSKLSKFESDIINDLENKGFSVIENYLKKEQCDRLSKKISLFIKKNPKKIYVGKYSSDKRIFGAEFIDPVISKYHNSNVLKKIGSFYMKCELKNLMTMANETIFKKKNLGSGEGWHRDNINKQYKSILYLQDVSNKNGPFQFIKDSQKIYNILKDSSVLKKKIQITRYKQAEINKLLKRKNYTIKTLTYKAGTLMIVDTSSIHRGSPLESGKRYALTNYYYPKKLISNYKNHFSPMIKKL